MRVSTYVNIEDEARYTNYRWVILGMTWIIQFLGRCSWLLVPSLAYCLFPELGLTQMQFTLILTGPLIAAIFLSFLGGGFADRYGIRLAVSIGSLLYGIAGVARAFVSSFEGMFMLMLLMGAVDSFTRPNLPKLVSVWFPRRQVGLATGIYVSAQALGFSMGLLSGPLFGGWRPAFLYVGMATLGAALLWILFGRSAPKGVEIPKPPIMSGVIKGMKTKNIRLTCTAMFLLVGTFVSFSGNFPKALQGVHQVSAQVAGAIASARPLGGAIGGVLLPSISDRVGLRKPFIYISAIMAAVCFYVGWYIAPATGTAVLMFMGGVFNGGLTSLLMVLPLEFPEIGREHVGGAAGLVGSLANLGGVLLPLLVMSPIVAAGTLEAYSIGFMVVMILLAGIVLPLAFSAETGVKARTPRGRTDEHQTAI